MAMRGHGGVPPGDASGGDGLFLADSGGFETLDMGAGDLKKGLAQFHVTELSGLRSVSENRSGLGGQKLQSFLGGNRYTPVGGVGVPASGKQQELAKSFVELLLSPTVQDSYVYGGYPVNGASLDKRIGDTLEGADDMGFPRCAAALVRKRAWQFVFYPAQGNLQTRFQNL